MNYGAMKNNYEYAFEIYKQSERIKNNFADAIIERFLELLKDECVKRKLTFVSINNIDAYDMMYFFSVNVSGYVVLIDLANDEKSQRKRIKNVLNKIRNKVYPVLAISGKEYFLAVNLGLVAKNFYNVGYIKAEDYYKHICYN